MRTAHLFQLITLAAIWGASFLFMRIAVPALGPVWLIEWRVLLGALLLALAGRWFRHSLALRTHWRHYLVLGCSTARCPLCFSPGRRRRSRLRCSRWSTPPRRSGVR